MNRNIRLIGILAMMLLVATVQMAGANIADHVVISEICVTGDTEWVELYNPTDGAIDLSNTPIYLCYYSHGKDWNVSFKPGTAKKELSGTIPTHGFYLVRIDGSTDDIPNPDYDWGYEGVASTLSDSQGSIGIFPCDPSTYANSNAANAGRIDAVAWGTVSSVKEGDEASVPDSTKTIQRKVSDTIDSHPDYGPAWDSDNNSADFFIQDSPNPVNSTMSSGNPVAPLPELPTITLTATGILVLAGYASLRRSRKTDK
ncbi:MAG: lamin tail domain-containing protein [Methanosarcinales archaeon]|nr:lamin tail domain-containing protein [Methanosarcinales archaeon]